MSIKVKNKLYALGDNVRYKQHRNKISALIRLSNKDYYVTLFENNFSSMKKTWEGINNLLHSKAKSLKYPSTFRDPSNSDKFTRNPLRISNILNTHFAFVGSHLAEKLPQTAHCNFSNSLAKSKSPESSFLFKPFQPRLTNRSLGLLQRHLKQCSPSIKETAVKALVSPQMDYCSSVWIPNEKGDVATLEKVQCRAARYVKNDYRRNPVSRK